MTQFLAPTFSVEVPDGAIDSSNYSFVLPDGSDTPPTVAILVQPEPTIPDLDELADMAIERLKEWAEDLIVHQRLVTTRDNWHYAMTVVEFGPPDARSTQKTVTLFIAGDQIRRYTIIGTARTDQFAEADAKFDAITRSFRPS